MEATFLAYGSSVAQKSCSIIRMDVKYSQLCQFDVMLSVEGTKVVCVCVCILREYV